MEKVYIVIVTYNGMKWIEKCLTSISLSNFPVETVTIDNNSSDSTNIYIKEKFPTVHLIESTSNLGFGKANNVGIKYALENKADYIFLLNQDAYIEPNTIKSLIDVYKKYETNKVGIVSPIHMNGNGSKVDPYFRTFVLGKCNDYLDDSIREKKRVIYESDFIPAAAWFMPIKTIQDIGGFDPLFYHYGEDDNYCYRIKYHQREIVFTTESFIYHDRENTVGNTKMYNKKLHYRHLIQYCCNINLSKGYIIQKLGRMLYDDIGVFITNLCCGKWQLLENFLYDYLKLLINIKKIKSSREQNKKIGNNWIN